MVADRDHSVLAAELIQQSCLNVASSPGIPPDPALGSMELHDEPMHRSTLADLGVTRFR